MASKRRATTLAVVLVASVSGVAATAGAAPASAPSADAALDSAITQFVRSPGGPPLVAAVVDRGRGPVLHSAGTALLGTVSTPSLDDQMRLASVSKAFSGAVALSLVRDHTLSLRDTVGRWLATPPAAWRAVNLEQLLQHTSGIPDFDRVDGLPASRVRGTARRATPADLLTYVSQDALLFKPGSRYHYSNSDNVIVGLIAQAATGRPYASLLEDRVFAPFGLTRASLPTDASMSPPIISGYAVSKGEPPEDVTAAFAAGWAWASGGINASLADTNRFIRAYVRGAETDLSTQKQQFRLVAGTSSPPGPGTNRAGLAIFEYRTACGTVYGHTGNTLGYTQFVAATRDGVRSAVVSVNEQISPKSDPAAFDALRRIRRLGGVRRVGPPEALTQRSPTRFRSTNMATKIPINASSG